MNLDTGKEGINDLNMFQKLEDQTKYIKETYPEITDSRIDEDHWDLFCSQCKLVRGFQVVQRNYIRQETAYRVSFHPHAPITIHFRCPVCKRYKFWITFKIDSDEKGTDGEMHEISRYYKVSSFPNEGLEDIVELPDKPESLRIAYKQAIRAMDANAHIAAAAMFRRALQVITRNILGASPGNLASELKEIIGTKYNGIALSKNFSDIGYIIKEAGNQGAHPDNDPDLLDFTQQDAEDLQKIFMELVSDLFVVPEAIKKSKSDFLSRRKIEVK